MGLTSAAKCPDFSTFLVGREGLEPPTPCASCRCSSELSQRPGQVKGSVNILMELKVPLYRCPPWCLYSHTLMAVPSL